jgi:hypothetical protein
MHHFSVRKIGMKNMLRDIFTSCPHTFRREILKEFEYVNGVVLDVGCGRGIPTNMLSEKCDYIIGVDVLNVFNFCKPTLSTFPLKTKALTRLFHLT